MDQSRLVPAVTVLANAVPVIAIQVVTPTDGTIAIPTDDPTDVIPANAPVERGRTNSASLIDV